MMACNMTILCMGQTSVTSSGPTHDFRLPGERHTAAVRTVGRHVPLAQNAGCCGTWTVRTGGTETEGSMSFAEKHPYLFWQLIGWGILLVDFVFVVIAIFNDFGEWSYPIIVFTFIGALFAIIGSPFCLYAMRATRVPQARSPEEDRAVRNKVGAIIAARKTPRAAMLGALVVVAAVVLAGVTYVMGMRGYVLLGFVMMVAMVVVPFVILAKCQDVQRRRFMKVAHAARFVDVESNPWALYRPDVRRLHAPLVPVPTGYGTAMLDFLYNWLHDYLMADRLELIQYSANDLRRAGFVAVDGDGVPLDAPDDLFLAVPENQLDLSGGKREQFEKECRAIGAFWLPSPIPVRESMG